MRSLVLFLLTASAAVSQVKPANPGFEQGEPGSVPQGWMVPSPAAQAGFAVTVAAEGCRSGSHCAMMTGVASPAPNVLGNIMQVIPANGYTQRRIRLRSAIRVEGEQTRAQMWLRLDRADNSTAFLENMRDRPVTSPQWATYDIETDVPDDISRIAFGIMLFGGGKAWVDDVSLEAIAEIRKDKVEPPRPLTPQGLANLVTFARLYGYVRHFHPSDQAAQTDWEAFAIDGVRGIEDAGSAIELAARLASVFEPVAPTVQVFETGRRPRPLAMGAGPNIISYRHHGVGLPTATIAMNIYGSERRTNPADGRKLPAPFEAELIPGLTVSVPLALYTDSDGTLPRVPLPAKPERTSRSAGDRGTRLAAVIIAWNVFQHFYPYFDVMKTDWAAELPKALRCAATDPDADAFHKTLRRMIAALKDGHGGVYSSRATAQRQPPLTLDWIENQFIVTRVWKDAPEGVSPGDRLLAIDGKPIEQAAAEARELTSGATGQWIRYRTAAELSRCNGDRMTLAIEPFAAPGTKRTVSLACVPPKFKDAEAYTEPRPDKIAELEPGIIYVDLDRMDEAGWKAAIPRLEKAKGIIFDMRGYPGRPGILALAHLTREKLRCARWNVPETAKPDRTEVTFAESGWDVPPEAPYFPARRVFLVDGRAISYAETVMGIVEHFRLGEIVGGPTAGTNGNVNPFRLPGGFTVSWTGMKVLKHDGSQHHGIGILPTVPAARTRQGVADGKDEILLRGLEVLKKQ